MSITHLIAVYGYFALFALVGIESLGIPLPGETALIIAGTFAGTTHRLNPWLIFLVAAGAAIVGDNIGFWIGDQGGYRLARAHGRRIRLDQHKLKIARYLFDRHGVKVVFFGRFISVLRTYAAFLAGTSKMRWHKFLAANAAGGILWAGIYTLIAYFAGRALQRASGLIDIILAVAAVLVIVVLVLIFRRQIGKLGGRAEAAYPGPLELAFWRWPAAPGASRRRQCLKYCTAVTMPKMVMAIALHKNRIKTTRQKQTRTIAPASASTNSGLMNALLPCVLTSMLALRAAP